MKKPSSEYSVWSYGLFILIGEPTGSSTVMIASAVVTLKTVLRPMDLHFSLTESVPVACQFDPVFQS
jgi:hypothetical protein